MNNQSPRSFERIAIASAILMSSLACGHVTDKINRQKSQDAPREEMRAYYRWIYEDLSGERQTKARKIEDYLRDKDVFRLSAPESDGYYALCDAEEVPRDICDDLLIIQRYVRDQDSKDSCSSDGCRAVTCGVTSC